MGRLVYFWPGRQGLRSGDLEAAGLAHVLGERGGFARAPGDLPGVGAGVYFAKSGTNLSGIGPLSWGQLPGAESIRLGWDPAARPTPEDLARPAQLDGHAVELGDGRRWLVPVARSPLGGTPLPRRLELGAAGWAEGAVVEPLRDLWEGACRVWERLLEAEAGEELDLDEEAQLATAALAANYYVGPAELSALGLLTTKVLAEVLLALVDWPSVKALTAEEIPQGNSEGPGFAPGPAASSPATAQPSPSSR